MRRSFIMLQEFTSMRDSTKQRKGPGKYQLDVVHYGLCDRESSAGWVCR